MLDCCRGKKRRERESRDRRQGCVGERTNASLVDGSSEWKMMMTSCRGGGRQEWADIQIAKINVADLQSGTGDKQKGRFDKCFVKRFTIKRTDASCQ